tara:strand:+ start:1180 stop:2247 length:1068 start_codon:yes stop_codon:yes gene_type:complete
MRNFKTILINIILLLIIGSFFEIVLRIKYSYDYSYYKIPKIDNDKVIKDSQNIHPYGIIPINSQGFYDKEWDYPKKKVRYGYFGDSVLYGVGAGFPYRITEYLDLLEPSIEHVNISEIGSSFLNYNDDYRLRNKLTNSNINKLIYVMNLNDIAPLSNYNLKNTVLGNNSDNSKFTKFFRNDFFKTIDNFFRGRSFLYTDLRLKFKNFLMIKLKLNSTGFKAIELFPEEHREEIKLGARTLASLVNKDIFRMPICILILPYEMQISKNAFKTYRNLNLYFEDDFINFKTQEIFISEFEKYSDNKIYFLGLSFEEKPVGTYFVYNKGDKIDYNHPNGSGHEILANEINEKRYCLDDN